MTETSNEVAIRTDRVSRSYQMGDALVHAVDDVTVSVRPKEFVALLGSSGSGKSTLLNLMAGLDRPTLGAIFAHGRNLAEMSSEDLAQHRSRTIGMVFQAFNLLPRMSALENVKLPLLYKDTDTPDADEQAEHALSLVGLANRERNFPSQLSGGQQQRVAIARALINKPAILLADEPTGALDSRTSAEIMSIFQGLNRTQGITIVLVTHSDEVAMHADRIIGFRDGLIVSDKPVIHPKVLAPAGAAQ